MDKLLLVDWIEKKEGIINSFDTPFNLSLLSSPSVLSLSLSLSLSLYLKDEISLTNVYTTTFVYIEDHEMQALTGKKNCSGS